jgi:hypothetical protein
VVETAVESWSGRAPAAPASPFAGPAGPSFDYDCSGAEQEQGSLAHWPGACNERGYLPVTPARTGAGVDDYCGSSKEQICYDIGVYGGCNTLVLDIDGGAKITCK